MIAWFHYGVHAWLAVGQSTQLGCPNSATGTSWYMWRRAAWPEPVRAGERKLKSNGLALCLSSRVRRTNGKPRREVSRSATGDSDRDHRPASSPVRAPTGGPGIRGTSPRRPANVVLERREPKPGRLPRLAGLCGRVRGRGRLDDAVHQGGCSGPSRERQVSGAPADAPHGPRPCVWLAAGQNLASATYRIPWWACPG